MDLGSNTLLPKGHLGLFPHGKKGQRPETKTVIWYGYETWSFTLREKRRLRMFENRELRRIFGLKRVRQQGVE
jgi:hypothetical protein